MSEEITAPETGAETTAVVEEAAVETPVEVQAETPPVVETEEKKPDRVAKRFSELSSQRDTARQEAEYWRQQALARQEPAQEEYDDPYSPDAIKAAVRAAIAEERTTLTKQQAQQAQAEKAETLRSKLFESGLEGAVLIASGAEVPFTQEMIDALAVSEQAAQVAHHLGVNPQEAGRIAALPAHLQGYELAKLESRLASLPRTTNALPPPTTVGSRATASMDPSGMDFEQYKAARESGRI